MSNLFITGIGGILLSGIFATVLMVSNLGAQHARIDACEFSSGYGIGARACIDSLSWKASSPSAEQRLAVNMAPAGLADRD